MIEDSKVVKSIQAKAGGKSGTYWTITWADDKTDNVFNGDWLPLLEQSQEESIPLHFTKEKRGNYYNIKTLEMGELPEEISPKTIESKPKEVILSKDAQIERAVWIKELGECIRSGDIDKTKPQGKALRDAYYAEMLRVLGINLKEVPPAKSLIEEAKKLGAKEIKPGEIPHWKGG